MAPKNQEYLEAIVQKNLVIMHGNGNGHMESTCESLGGNGGILPDKRPCAVYNFYFDAKTGEIVYFGNVPNVPKLIIDSFTEGAFRVAFDFKLRKSEIVDAIVQNQSFGRKPINRILEADSVSDFAKAVFANTMLRYNAGEKPAYYQKAEEVPKKQGILSRAVGSIFAAYRK